MEENCLGSDIVGSAELRKREHEKRKKTGGKGFFPFSFFLFRHLFACLPPSRLPHSFASSPLSESLEQAIHFATFWSRCKILACEVRLCAGSKIFSFAFLASFFSFTDHLEGFILVGKVLRNAFTILGLDERKARWVVKQDFHGNFSVNVTWFFAIFSGVLYWIVLILVWFERSLLPTQIRGQCCSRSLIDDGTSGRRDVNPHGRLRAVQGRMG